MGNLVRWGFWNLLLGCFRGIQRTEYRFPPPAGDGERYWCEGLGMIVDEMGWCDSFRRPKAVRPGCAGANVRVLYRLGRGGI